MYANPLTAIDFYKADHRRQYPEGTTQVYSNFTPRTARLSGMTHASYDNKIVFFGLQYFIIDFLINTWQAQFFNQPKATVVQRYKRRMDAALGANAIDTAHIAALHDLGYLPLQIKALPEGTRVPIGVPVLTVVNTHPDFFWLTNYIETVLSCYLWKSCTSASLAFEYNRLLTAYADKTGSPRDFVRFQAHDFSFRGMSGLHDAALTGAGHLTSFMGTDTVPAIDLVEDYYNINADTALVGCSVPATEHSVMCMGLPEGELATFKRLITQLYPSGFVSIVSDTWDFWRVVTDYTRTLKDDILARDGKVVLRPDSGDPVHIIAGDADAPVGSAQHKGAVECLWDIFGGTHTPEGYKLLDSHIGLIYGDSITLPRAEAILRTLAAKGFASANIVFGVGSFTYQHVTRDSFGFAMKATSGIVNGQRRDICKDPKTDSGTKKSAKGLLRVAQQGDTLVVYDQQTPAQEAQGLLEVVFLDGQLTKTTTLADIRARVAAAIQAPAV